MSHSHGQAAAAPRWSRSAGATLIEVVLVAAVFPVLVYSALGLVQSGQNLDRQVRSKAVMMEKLRTTMRRLGDEVRTSSRTAEDRNGNGTLDAGEDRNGNGRLDSDWQVGSSSLRFNRLLADGNWGLPITYRLDGTDLVRVYHRTLAEVETVRMVSGVSSFTVTTPSAETVSIAMSVQVRGPGGRIDSESTSLTIQLRN